MKDIIIDKLNNPDQAELGAAEERMNEMEVSPGNFTLNTHKKVLQYERELPGNGEILTHI